VGEIKGVRRLVAGLIVIAILAWVLLPVARAYSLVSAQHSDSSVPTDLGVADVTFESTDGTPIRAWLAPAKIGAPAVVLVHGFKTSRAEMLPWARFLHEAGYNALLLDLRGAGRSGGATIGLGATETRDIVQAAQTAGEAFRTDHVAVLGISLGAGAAILAAADDPRITAVVADSAWTDQDFLLARLGFIDIGAFRLPLPPLGVPAVNACRRIIPINRTLVTPIALTTSGSVGTAIATRFCTSTCALFTFVPSSKATSRLYDPSLLLCDVM